MSEEFYQFPVGSLQKIPRFASPKYITWIKQQPCANCGTTKNISPHHIKGVGHFSGGGLRAPDSAVMPMCLECHSGLHGGDLPLEAQWEWMSRTLILAIVEIAEGRLKI